MVFETRQSELFCVRGLGYATDMVKKSLEGPCMAAKEGTGATGAPAKCSPLRRLVCPGQRVKGPVAGEGQQPKVKQTSLRGRLVSP